MDSQKARLTEHYCTGRLTDTAHYHMTSNQFKSTRRKHNQTSKLKKQTNKSVRFCRHFRSPHFAPLCIHGRPIFAPHGAELFKKFSNAATDSRRRRSRAAVGIFWHGRSIARGSNHRVTKRTRFKSLRDTWSQPGAIDRTRNSNDQRDHH